MESQGAAEDSGKFSRMRPWCITDVSGNSKRKSQEDSSGKGHH